MLVVEAVGLHQPRQGRVVRLVAFGTAEGVFLVAAPPLGGCVDAFDALPGGLVGAIGAGGRAGVVAHHRFFGMALQA